MPNIFDSEDPKAVPEAPTGRKAPEIPIGMALDMDEAAYEERDYAPVEAEEPEVEEKPIDLGETVGEVVASVIKNGGEYSIDGETAEVTTVRKPAEEVEAEDIAIPDSLPVDKGGSEDDEKIEPTPEPNRVTVVPGGGFGKGDGASEAATAATNMVRALVNSTDKDQPVDEARLKEFFTPLMEIANRAERTAVRDALQAQQTESIHGMNFPAVVSIQRILDFIAKDWTSGPAKRKTAEERAYEKRVKVTREGASVIIAAYELLKSITPEGADVHEAATEASKELISEVGQYVRWTEGGSKPAEEPQISALARRALAAFRAGVKGIKLEDHLRPTTHNVVTVKKDAHKVETPSETPEQDSSDRAREHIEGLFARLQPGQWVSIDQLVKQETKQFPDPTDRPHGGALQDLIYSGEIEGVDGYTEEGVTGGWKPVA